MSTRNSNTSFTLEHLDYVPISPELYQSNSDKSSSYEQTLLENNLQLTELQLYSNNGVGCIVIVHLISSRIQYHKLNSLTQYENILQLNYLQIKTT